MMTMNEQEFLVQKIRTQYTEKEHTRLDELKALDRKVKKPAELFNDLSSCLLSRFSVAEIEGKHSYILRA